MLQPSFQCRVSSDCGRGQFCLSRESQGRKLPLSEEFLQHFSSCVPRHPNLPRSAVRLPRWRRRDPDRRMPLPRQGWGRNRGRYCLPRQRAEGMGAFRPCHNHLVLARREVREPKHLCQTRAETFSARRWHPPSELLPIDSPESTGGPPPPNLHPTAHFQLGNTAAIGFRLKSRLPGKHHFRCLAAR